MSTKAFTLSIEVKSDGLLLRLSHDLRVRQTRPHLNLPNQDPHDNIYVNTMPHFIFIWNDDMV